MRTEYKIVTGMALMGGTIMGTFIYVSGLFAAPQEAPPMLPTITLPAPAVSTVLPPTVAPTPVAPTPTAEPVLEARLSHYWPAFGPPNCHPDNWTGTECTTMLSDGRNWEHWTYWVDIGIACPVRFDIGTKIAIEGFGTGIWTCVDRGGAISTLPDGTFFLDLLTREQPYVSPDEATIARDIHSPHGNYIVIVRIMQ